MDFSSFHLLAAGSTLPTEQVGAADGIELRMDLADDPLGQVAEYDGSLPVLVTNRVAWEGGDAPDTAQRLDALREAIAFDAVTAVDIELAALTGDSDHDPMGVVEQAREQDVSVVVSAHDFERTPGRERIIATLERACGYGDVGKIATTAHTPDDVLAMLDATRAMTAAGESVATMCMGETGRHSRAVAPLYGSKIGYAPVDPADATAPGQYDLATLRSLTADLQSE